MAVELESVERALWLVEKTHEIGRMTGAILASVPGWDKVKAHRYLTKLSALGWLERLPSSGKSAEYVLGRKMLAMAPDWRGL